MYEYEILQFFSATKCINGIDEISVHGKIQWVECNFGIKPLFSQFDNPWYFVSLTLISRKNANISGQTSRNHIEASLHVYIPCFRSFNNESTFSTRKTFGCISQLNETKIEC